MTRVSVIVPTVTGREDHLERCLAAYRENSVNPVEVIVITDRSTCGQAWIEGAEAATGDYVHFSADDLEPAPGWDEHAVGFAATGVQPSPRILGPGGDTQFCGHHGPNEWPSGYMVPMSVIPFLSRPMLAAAAPLLEAHYYTDNWISWKLLRAGFPTVLLRSYQFTHHWAEPARGAGMAQDERMAVDLAAFTAAMTAEVE